MVADITVNNEVITRLDRFGHTAAVIAEPTQTRSDDVARECTIEDVVMGTCSSSLGRIISSLNDGSNLVD